MIAFLVAELGEWRKKHMRKTLCLSAILLALIGLIGPLQPLLLALAGTLIFIVSAWSETLNPPSESRARPNVRAFPANSFEKATGKALSVLVIWLGIGLVLSPILAASAVAWGLSGETMAFCLLCWLSAFLLAASIGFVSELIFDRSEGLVGLGVYLIWLFSSFFIPWLKPSNPFIQVWSILRLEGGSAPCACIFVEAAVAALLFACSVPLLGLGRRNRNA
jgi:hypothetical protein